MADQLWHRWEAGPVVTADAGRPPQTYILQLVTRKSPEEPLSVLYVAAECFPMIKVGGLGDVAGFLPKALARLGHDVRVVLPFYSSADLNGDPHQLTTVPVDLGGRPTKAEIFQTSHPSGATTYLVANQAYFRREHAYGYPDDDERFIFFCKAVAAFLAASRWVPDVVHCNDWHSAMIPYYLRNGSNPHLFSRTSTVFTIHNLSYQGPYTTRTQELMDLPQTADGNMMAMGIRYADALNTVSPTYLSEILTPEFGENMDGLLRERLPDLRGILNGIDYDEFNPSCDLHIPAWYDVHSIPKKTKNKTVLQHWSRLPLSEATPVVGFVSRLAEQKGIDLICHALEPLMEMGIQLVVMGRGDAGYEEMLKAHADRHPGTMTYHQRDDETLARLIYAGADILLAPSNFEPCGLGPLIAIRYGTVPTVRATGGLVDTIINYADDPARGLGFSFDGKAPQALVDAVESALIVYYRREQWRSLVRRLMTADFSWGRSSREYVRLYRYALRKQPRTPKSDRRDWSPSPLMGRRASGF